MTQVYVVHGYTANGDKHWFPWLEQELAKIGVPCVRLTMPHSQHPQPEEWLAHLQHHAPIDENTLFVAHSLGTIATLTHIAAAQKQPKGCVLVSGFYQPLANLPELTPFVEFYRQFPAYLPQNATTISAFDDDIVPPHYTQALAQYLGVDFHCLHTGGHFLDRTGCTELPLALALVKQLCK